MDIEQVMDSTNPMSMFLEEDFSLYMPKTGEICEGTVVYNGNQEVLVDIGAKSEGMIDIREVEQMNKPTRAELYVGNTIPVYVLQAEDHNGSIILSYEKAIAESDWLMAQNLLESQEDYEATILGFNKGGLLTTVGKVRAFIPASQLGATSYAQRSEEHLSQFVDEVLSTKVIEVDRSRNRLILSAREAMQKSRDAHKSKLLGQLQVNDVCHGKIVNIEDFGLFVDIGGVQGLVHLSELSWKRVSNPRDLYEIGDDIDVSVINIDNKKQRVALSVKRLLSDPWSDITAHHHEGELVEVTITKIERYGAFARINSGIGLEGLIHISEFSDKRVKHPSQVVEKGQIVNARVIRINSEQRQLGLSLKQVDSAEHIEQDLKDADHNATFTAEVETKDADDDAIVTAEVETDDADDDATLVADIEDADNNATFTAEVEDNG